MNRFTLAGLSALGLAGVALLVLASKRAPRTVQAPIQLAAAPSSAPPNHTSSAPRVEPTSAPATPFNTPVARETSSAQVEGLAVLTYHRIADHPRVYTVTSPASFEAQMAFLHAHHFQVVSLRSAVKALQNGEPLPHRAVVLTFDDGYADCFSRVWPVLKRYNFPATLFIYPAYIGNGGAALSWAQLQQLHGSGLFDVQCHTLTHPNLSHRKNEESNDDYEARLKQELEASKAQLESRLHIRVTQLAFPYGAFNEQVLRATKAAGFEAAWTVNEAPVVSVCGDNQTLWTLPREVMNREDSLEDFAAKIESAPLAIREMTPRPNTSSQSPTEIRAVLGEDVRPDSVSMALGRESVSARYDVRTRELSYRPIKPLRAGAYPVNIVARDQNGRPLRASWEFIATKTRIETSSGSRS